jgi:hypothetical protein
MACKLGSWSKVRAFVQQTGLRGRFDEQLSQTLVGQTQFITMIDTNLVTPKTAAKHEQNIQQMYKCSFLARTLGVIN